MTPKHKPVLLTLVVLLWATTLTACGSAEPAEPRLRIENAWARPAGQGSTGAVYLTVVNEGGAPDALLAARSDVAAAVELHESKMEGDVMRMQPVTKVSVPANGQVAFKPGSFHIMLIDLQQDLQSGDQFEITLQFEKSGEISLQVEVKGNP